MSSLSDRRRNLGPTDQIHFDPVNTETPLKPNTELRPVFVSQGIAKHASGSSYMETGDLKLHATVHGPQQLRGEYIDQAEIEVNVQVESFAGIVEKEDVSQSLSDFIRSSITPAIILKEYPKSRIVISLSIVSGRKGAPLVAASVNAVTMALVNAGIALHDMVVAVAIAKAEGTLYVDSAFEENTDGLIEVVAARSANTMKLISMIITSHGHVSKDDLKLMLGRAKTESQRLRDILSAFLVEDYAKHSS